MRLAHVEEHHVGILRTEGVAIYTPVPGRRGLYNRLFAECLQTTLVYPHLAPSLVSGFDKAIHHIWVYLILRDAYHKWGITPPHAIPVAGLDRNRYINVGGNGRSAQTPPATLRQTERPVACRYRDTLGIRLQPRAGTPVESVETEIQRCDIHRHRDVGIVGKDVRGRRRPLRHTAAAGCEHSRQGRYKYICDKAFHHRLPAGSSPANMK